MTLARLCYVSKATKPNHLLREDLMDIINEAVEFNTEHQVFGVLYYGHGYFFQCLEGDRVTLEALFYQRIEPDKRHKNVNLLEFNDIDLVRFDSWNMKFAPYEKNLMHFFGDIDHPEFNPYLLDDSQLPKFLDVLYAA